MADLKSKSAGRLLLSLLAVTLICATSASGQAVRREPHIGYAYPAGGRQGDTFQILVGGQNLRGVNAVHVSGTGVQASVIKHYRPLTNLDQDQRLAVQTRMRELFEMRIAELPEAVRTRIPLDREFPRARRAAAPAAKSPPDKQDSPGKPDRDARSDKTAALPEHPIFSDLESKDLRGLLHVRDELAAFRKRQPNPQIAESVAIQLTINARAALGDREIRLITPQGLTNPLRFQVSTLPEVREAEPNEPGAYPFLPADPPLQLPVLVNGQVKPGDVDHISFQARSGQKLVIRAWARHLMPYLADAVPGWFQATLTLFDPAGREIAFADDYRFDPDPVLYYEVPYDGSYTVEIRDSIYRGREDFVYRLAIGEGPFITQTFPLGGRTGTRTTASIEGWNLPTDQLLLATPPGNAGLRQAALRIQQQPLNEMVYAVDMLPEAVEAEPNDSADSAQRIEIPRIVNGVIAAPGDVDVFAISGTAGQELVFEVYARRLHSPLDSLVQLLDSSARVLAFNDDCEQKESGLLTHHADSYLKTSLPADGIYYVRISDAQQQGGPAHSYRLRMSAPRPDFALRVTPSSLNVRAGWSAPICVYALRRDGFSGPVDVVLKNKAGGMRLGGGRIPAGQDRVRMTITAPPRPLAEPLALELEGTARVNGQVIRRQVVPAEDMMQAFAYQHLVPSQQLVALTLPGGRLESAIEVNMTAPVRLAPGQSAVVRLHTPQHPRAGEVQFELREPSAGITLESTRIGGGAVTLTLKATDEVKPGLKDNLIVEAFAKPPARQPDAKGPQNQRVSLGVLPAIPLEVAPR